LYSFTEKLQKKNDKKNTTTPPPPHYPTSKKEKTVMQKWIKIVHFLRCALIFRNSSQFVLF